MLFFAKIFQTTVRTIYHPLEIITLQTFYVLQHIFQLFAQCIFVCAILDEPEC